MVDRLLGVGDEGPNWHLCLVGFATMLLDDVDTVFAPPASVKSALWFWL